MIMTAAMKKTAFVIAGAVTLFGCATSPPTQMFTLDSVAASSGIGATYVGAPIKVDVVQIPPSLNRPELVRQLGPDLLQVEDFAHWSAPLGQLARTALTQDLAARLPPGRVIYPDASSPRDARGLSVNILAFASSAGAAYLDVSWTLVEGEHATAASKLEHWSDAGGQPTAPAVARASTSPEAHLLRRTLRLTVPVSGASAQDQATALSRLLGQLSDDVVEDVETVDPASPN